MKTTWGEFYRMDKFNHVGEVIAQNVTTKEDVKSSYQDILIKFIKSY